MSRQRQPLSHRYADVLDAHHQSLMPACGEFRDPDLPYNLGVALQLIRHTRKWDDSDAVYRTFARRVDEVAPVFARAPEELRRQVLYQELCERSAHAEAWLYRAGTREAGGPAATKGWAPAYYDWVKKELGRNVVGAAVADRAAPWVVQNLIDRGEPVGGVDRSGHSALHHAVLAAEHDQDLAAVYLSILLDAGAEPTVCDARGLTPLDLAVPNCYSQAIRALVVAGAVPDGERERRFVRSEAKDMSWRRALSRHKERWKEAEARETQRIAQYRAMLGIA